MQHTSRLGHHRLARLHIHAGLVERLYLLSQIVKVDSNALLLHKFDALYSDLVVLLHFFQTLLFALTLIRIARRFQLVNAALLVRLIFLQKNQHLEADLVVVQSLAFVVLQESHHLVVLDRLEAELIH